MGVEGSAILPGEGSNRCDCGGVIATTSPVIAVDAIACGRAPPAGHPRTGSHDPTFGFGKEVVPPRHRMKLRHRRDNLSSHLRLIELRNRCPARSAAYCSRRLA